jgi:hypothetical protein
MCAPLVKCKPDGSLIVVDYFSGKRYPEFEELHILANLSEEEKDRIRSATISDQQH